MEQLTEQFVQAGTLMLAGMSVVFVFLGLLIWVVQLLAKLAVIFPDPVVQVKEARQVRAKNEGLSPSLVAAISTAVVRYRNNNK
jgi:oxaloacetate decarboxylase gamma subunit